MTMMGDKQKGREGKRKERREKGKKDADDYSYPLIFLSPAPTDKKVGTKC